MENLPLRYKISSWHQLPQCMSNNSIELKISVTDFINNNNLSGTRIQVMHPELGVLFACVVNADGNIISCAKCNQIFEFTPAQIISELEKYGFLIEYNPESSLSGDQLQYLITLNNLDFDKIRVLNVWSTDRYTNVKSFKTMIVAFLSQIHPYWLNNDYSCSEQEFTKALNRGSAINLTEISKTKKYDWSWLKGFVGSIPDILQDNAEVTSCQ